MWETELELAEEEREYSMSSFRSGLERGWSGVEFSVKSSAESRWDMVSVRLRMRIQLLDIGACGWVPRYREAFGCCLVWGSSKVALEKMWCQCLT